MSYVSKQPIDQQPHPHHRHLLPLGGVGVTMVVCDADGTAQTQQYPRSSDLGAVGAVGAVMVQSEYYSGCVWGAALYGLYSVP